MKPVVSCHLKHKAGVYVSVTVVGCRLKHLITNGTVTLFRAPLILRSLFKYSPEILEMGE